MKRTTVAFAAWAAAYAVSNLLVQAFAVHYAYDDAGRLLQADYGGGQRIDYAYDANGNLTLRSASGGTEFVLVYTALAGGSILGAATQTVAHGGSGTAVTAVTNLYYAFAQWSDGLGTETRTDTNVAANLSVAAQFSAILAAGGTPHWWLAGHYPGSNDFDAAENGNTDGDPFTAGQEYVADTDPTNPASFFQILEIDPGPPVVVTFDPGSIHSVLLSHAHIDHSGNLPNLVKRGFGGSIVATPATADLCRVMLRDSAFIQEKDAEWLSRRNELRRTRRWRDRVGPHVTREGAGFWRCVRDRCVGSPGDTGCRWPHGRGNGKRSRPPLPRWKPRLAGTNR